MMASIAPRIRIPALHRRTPDLHLYGAVFAGAALSFCVARLLDGRFGLATDLFVVAGSATCGWSWLLSRALFRAPVVRHRDWALVLVLALVAVEVFLYFGDRGTPFVRMIGNAETLVSSTVLLLAMIEPLKDMHSGMARPELRFRAVFSGGYATLLAIAVIGIDGASPGSVADIWGGTIKAVCAGLALVGTGLAVRYRLANPLPGIRAERRPAIADESGLSDRLVAVMRDEAVYTRPELRVADVARRLGEAEYKVTRCITGGLGFRNFNHMVNHVRIAAAKRKFADAACDTLPILTIALDCGFGSIGPFNRAFKAEAGMTPMQFRRTGRDANAAGSAVG